MPRSTQSRESGIVNYFKSADLAIAQVVLGLATDAVKERKAKSSEARERALKSQAPKPIAPPKRDSFSLSTAPAKPKVKRRKKRTKRQPAAEIESPAVYSEDDLNS
jgi:hypothetical protein